MFKIGEMVVSNIWGVGRVIAVKDETYYQVRFNGFWRFVNKRYLRSLTEKIGEQIFHKKYGFGYITHFITDKIVLVDFGHSIKRVNFYIKGLSEHV